MLLRGTAARSLVSTPRDRVHHALVNGARPLDTDRWLGLVEESARLLERQRPVWADIDPAPLINDPPKARPVYILPEQVVVEAQLLLDLELALARAEEVSTELRELAAEEIDKTRRTRLQQTIATAIERIEARMRRGGET
jgi:hypothetical protein